MKFYQEIAHLSELPMRIVRWREKLFRATDEEIEEAINQAAIAAELHDHQAILAFQALIALLIREEAILFTLRRIEPGDKRSPFALLIFEEGEERVADPEDFEKPPVFAHRETTLGERRSLARSQNRDLLARLAFDEDPGVIARFLQNPHITEQDVLRLASRRPASGEILRLIFLHPRWIASPNIVEALLRNPYTPFKLALGLLFIASKAALDRLITSCPESPLAKIALARSESRSQGTSYHHSSPDSEESFPVFELSLD